MYSLRPKNYSMESINDKYQYVFAKSLKDCKIPRNISCPTVWWYNSCIGNNMINNDTNVSCPFFKTTVTFRCTYNGEWNGTEISYFNLCNGMQFLLRTQIEKYFGFILYPLQMVVFLTSIFKISIFDEIVKDFSWRIIIWYLRAKSIKYAVDWMLVVMNSNYIVSALCFSLTLIPVLSDFFSLSCEMALFFYVYIILFRFDVQIRTIKSALFRVTVMTPILAIIVCLVLDMNKDDNYNYFECQSDIYGSRILHAYITVHLSVTIILVYLWIAISKKIEEIKKESLIGIYRMEYDIVGARKEISKREMFRILYTLNWILSLGIFKNAILISSIYQMVTGTPTKYSFLISAGATFIITTSEMITVIAIIWKNKHFKARQEALRAWYLEIEEEKNIGQEEEDFKSALKETTDENTLTG